MIHNILLILVIATHLRESLCIENQIQTNIAASNKKESLAERIHRARLEKADTIRRLKEQENAPQLSPELAQRKKALVPLKKQESLAKRVQVARNQFDKKLQKLKEPITNISSSTVEENTIPRGLRRRLYYKNEAPLTHKQYKALIAKQKIMHNLELEHIHNKRKEAVINRKIFGIKRDQLYRSLQEEESFITNQALADNNSPFRFLASLDTKYFLGNNIELLNSANEFDNYSFIQYTLDTGIYVHPHTHLRENESLEFKALVRLKGNAGNVGRYLQTERIKTRIGWAITEHDHSHDIDRMLVWARTLWLKYYLTTERTSFIQMGFFPYTLGHGIALGSGHHTSQPLPGNYSTQDVDQFRPGVLIQGTNSNEQLLYNLYFGTIATKSDTYNATAAFANAQSREGGKISRGPWKSNHIFAAQLTCRPKTAEKTICDVSSYFVFNHNNTDIVEFDNDASSKLFTLGMFGQAENGPLSVSFEYARNFGSQRVKKWDRNGYHIGAVTFNTHLFYINPTGYTQTTYNALGTADELFSPAIGLTTPHDLAERYDNGEIFDVTSTGAVTTLKYKNSYNRFRNGYENRYEGWFVYTDACYQFNYWKLGAALGILSGDNSPNDSEDLILAARLTPNITYKDKNKNYKGFSGIQEMFKSNAITPCFIHEVQKLNAPLRSYSKLTEPLLTNLFFTGIGIHYDSVLHHKQLHMKFNALGYIQHKQTTKGTNIPYSEAESATFTVQRQTDREKPLDTFLGIELNALGSLRITHDLNVSYKVALFIPGSYYETARGKYIPIKHQINFAGADSSGVRDTADVYNITLGKDPALMISVGARYDFDSLTLTKKQHLHRNRKQTR